MILPSSAQGAEGDSFSPRIDDLRDRKTYEMAKLLMWIRSVEKCEGPGRPVKFGSLGNATVEEIQYRQVQCSACCSANLKDS